MSIRIAAIQFNHDPNSAQVSALNIRRNVGETIPTPEWRADSVFPPRNSIAAYAIQQVRGQTVLIKAQFQRLSPEIASAEVRAVPAEQLDIGSLLNMLNSLAQLLWLPQYFTTVAAYASYVQYIQYYSWLANVLAQAPLMPGHILGEVKPSHINFGTTGTTGMVPLELQQVQFAERGVGIYPVRWRWQYRLSGQEQWRDIGISEHIIYAILDVPTEPWVQQPFLATNTQLPWSEVLDVACSWAAGAKTPAEAARRITESVNKLGDGVFEYGCLVGGAELYASTLFDSFDCTSFLDRLRGGAGNGRYLNCSDCATIVSTFANALGCDLWQSRMGEYIPSFPVNPVLALGSQAWQIPCGQSAGFTFHEVAWGGSATAADPVYDASLSFDADWQPGLFPHQRLLPIGMRFGEIGEGLYRDRLATPIGRVLCQPRPEERRRRWVF